MSMIITLQSKTTELKDTKQSQIWFSMVEEIVSEISDNP